MYPGVWRHGDWIEITSRGTAIIYGRSDSTINRSGIRMGTSEIYRAVLSIDEIVDALVVDVPRPGTEGWMPLFVVLREGAELDDELPQGDRHAGPRATARRATSPTRSSQIAEVPRTLSGKVLEVPVKRILMGTPPRRPPAATRSPTRRRSTTSPRWRRGCRAEERRRDPPPSPADLPAPRSPSPTRRGCRRARRSGSASRATITEQPTATTRPVPASRHRWAASSRGTTRAKAIAIEAAAVVWPLGKRVGADLFSAEQRLEARMGEQDLEEPAWSGWHRRRR